MSSPLSFNELAVNLISHFPELYGGQTSQGRVVHEALSYALQARYHLEGEPEKGDPPPGDGGDGGRIGDGANGTAKALMNSQ